MPIRKITSVALGSPTTSRILAITSSETIYAIQSGNRACELTNLGSYNVYYGQSAVLVNSGQLLLPSGTKMFDTIVGDFTLYVALATGGVTSNVVATEYAGN